MPSPERGGIVMGDLPPLGGHAPALRCGRLLRFPNSSSQCPEEATHHVIWTEDCENGLVCEAHRIEAVSQWEPYAVHPYDMACSMPGAVFIHAENRCVTDEEWLGVTTEQEMSHAG